MMKKLKGFTLIELLVAISIVAILAGLTVPAITGAISRTNQAKDLSNAKQLAQVLLVDANENNGLFRVAEDRTSTTIAGYASDVFRGLLKDKVLTTTEVLSGYATQSFDDGTNYDNLGASNVSWAYVAGLTTGDDDRMPLLISKGNTNITTEILTGSPSDVSLMANSTWGDRGVIIAYKGQNAEFKKAKDGKIRLGINTPTANTNVTVLKP